MMRVVLANGQSLAFQEGATFEIEETGQLRVFIDGTDVAIFAHRGWLCVGRSTPEKEPEDITADDSNKAIIEDELDDEDDFQ